MYDTVLEFVADRVGVVFRVLATGGGGGGSGYIHTAWGSGAWEVGDGRKEGGGIDGNRGMVDGKEIQRVV